MKYINKEYVESIDSKYNSGEVISRRKSIYYKGNQYTLNDNVYYVLNNTEKIEWAKCYKDPIYFIEKYLNIKLRKYQIEWIKLYKEQNIIYNVSRQTGINSILSALNLHSMIFNNQNIILIPCKYNIGVEFINLIKKYYMLLPYFLKPNIKTWNNKSIEFTNSKICVFNNDTNLVEYDILEYHDFAFNSNYPKFEVDNNKLIITSTPNGKNYFYDLYKNSILPEGHPDKNSFKSIQTYWYEVEGRDEQWRINEIKRLGSIDKFNREHNLEF